MSEHCAPSHPVIAAAAREGPAGARCRQCLEARRLEDPGASGIERVGDDEGTLRLMESAEGGAPQRLQVGRDHPAAGMLKVPSTSSTKLRSSRSTNFLDWANWKLARA